MASDVDICNTGLSHLGARAQISAISPPDGTVEAGYCARFYPIARRELLESYPWSFATTRVLLAEVTNPSTVWDYAYALPSDCLKPLRVLSQTAATTLYGIVDLYDDLPALRFEDSLSERESADFVVEGDVILTNEPEAVMVYRYDVIDTSKYSPAFVSAAGMLLAGYLAGPIIKGMDGAKVGAQWRQAAHETAAKAATSNANGSSAGSDHVPTHLAVR
jgi:hypothetical protein